MHQKLNHFVHLIKAEFRHLVSISFGVFLFVLFFQPFSLDRFDFNNKLVFVGGLGAIVFLNMLIIRLIFQYLDKGFSENKDEPVFLSYFGGFIILVVNSLAFAFYLHYVGSVSITFYNMVKIVLICLAPPIALWLKDNNMALLQQVTFLINENRIIKSKLEQLEEEVQTKTIEFVSENNTDKLSVAVADVVMIKSADNYVEIVYREEGLFRKKLLRNTLKNIEWQIRPFSSFIRCHRVAIVNKQSIEKLHRNYNSHWLTLKGYDEKVAVSRHYLLNLKAYINEMG